jgi:ribosomal protein L11 methyltransferase
VTLDCSRVQAMALENAEELFTGDSQPVLVSEEPDPSRPDDWLLHAYFDREPRQGELDRLLSMSRGGEPRIEQLGEDDWVTMSQSGLAPIRAGRFFVHTPMVSARPPGAITFEIDAGLAFGTGQHATTAGCLDTLDTLERDGADFANIADIGTGTGLLAFASMALWPTAKCIATDVDPIAIDVARDNMAINGVATGHGAGELLLAVADGMGSPLLEARSPFDLIIANILAGPLIELSADFSAALAPGGTIVLAGLLDKQARGVAEAYEKLGFTLAGDNGGEWPVLVMTAPQAK